MTTVGVKSFEVFYVAAAISDEFIIAAWDSLLKLLSTWGTLAGGLCHSVFVLVCRVSRVLARTLQALSNP